MVTRLPIVLAPLAGGASTPELAAAVTNAGGLGFVAGGYLTAEELGERIARTRALTDGPIGVNLFVLEDVTLDEAALGRYALELAPEAERRGVRLGAPRFDDDELDAKLDVVVGAGVEVVSTTFGCLAADVVSRLPDVWATVTSRAEAVAARDAGATALVVQGSEAGGHRGSWDDFARDEGVPLASLLATVREAVDLPLVATGGIADRAAVRAALAAGAVAAQVGSAFLLAPEAGTPSAHRVALGWARETAMTRAFTGRLARGITNAFMQAHRDAPSAYPHVHHLTAPLRAAARLEGDAEGINLWAGVNYSLAEERAAGEIVTSLAP